MKFLISILLASTICIFNIDASCNDIINRIERVHCKIKESERAKADDMQKLVMEMMPKKCKMFQNNPCGECACVEEFRLEKKYFCDCRDQKPMRDCMEYRTNGHNRSGLYRITMMNYYNATQVFCDQETDNGGWTVFQRRLDGKTNFYRDKVDYANGFGNPALEFWLGNDIIYLLTLQALHPYGSELRVDMTDWDRQTVFAKYKHFKVDNKIEKYRLSVGDYSGDAGDSLTYHDGQKFSTYDEDNDSYGGNCASSYRGAWWYNGCQHVNLNGEYRWAGESIPHGRGVIWYHHKNSAYHSMKFVEMKVRRVV